MIKVLTEGCEPTKGTKYSACIDLYAAEDCVIDRNNTKIVPLGIALDQEQIKSRYSTRQSYGSVVEYNDDHYTNFMGSHYVQLQPRSSLRAKGVMSGTGIIDMDYPDEIKIILHNFKNESFVIKKGDRIAQMMLCTQDTIKFGVSTDEIRTGGIGSTGE